MLKTPPTKPDPFAQELATILKRKGFTGETSDYPLLNELAGSYAYNDSRTGRKVEYYKWGGFFLLFAIPLLSTVIAATANGPDDSAMLACLKSSIPATTLILAILTTLNSIIRPGQRFNECCRIRLDYFHWKCEFLEGLEKLSKPVTEEALLALLEAQRKRMKPLQEKPIALALPDQS